MWGREARDRIFGDAMDREFSLSPPKTRTPTNWGEGAWIERTTRGRPGTSARKRSVDSSTSKAEGSEESEAQKNLRIKSEEEGSGAEEEAEEESDSKESTSSEKREARTAWKNFRRFLIGDRRGIGESISISDVRTNPGM